LWVAYKLSLHGWLEILLNSPAALPKRPIPRPHPPRAATGVEEAAAEEAVPVPVLAPVQAVPVPVQEAGGKPRR